jgi:hypothetical protein
MGAFPRISTSERNMPVQLQCICSWCGAVLGPMTYCSTYPSFGICAHCIRTHFSYLFESADDQSADGAPRGAPVSQPPPHSSGGGQDR